MTMRLEAILATAILVWPWCAAAADKAHLLPKDLPAYGPLKPAPAPAVRQVKLDNGLQVWLVSKPGFPKVAFTVAVRGGYVADPGNRPGMADLIAAVVGQGTKTRSAKQIAEQLQAAGGDLNAEATSDALLLSTSVLSAKTATALTLLADVTQNATFAEDEVEIARKNAAAGLEASEADPGFLGRRALYGALFGTHPYSVTAPTRESIASVTPAELRTEYARRFRPDQMLLVAVGDLDEVAVTAAVRTNFGAWRPAGTAVSAGASKPDSKSTRAVVYVPRAESVQTALYIGALGPTRSDADYAATRVANAIYGGMFGSRLVTNIREDKGYTYSPGSRLSPLRATGVIGTRADVRNPVTGASYNEISYELNRIATTEPDAQELESAKRYIVGSLAIQRQSREAVARALANAWIDSLPPEYLASESQAVEKVSAKDVEAAGRRYFPASRMTVVAVGEEKVIKEELAPFGFEFQRVQ